jgi:hypothetical protein
MTLTPNPPALLPVIQADRAAAADLMARSDGVSSAFATEHRAGYHDSSVIVQAFARHRLQSTPAEPKVSREANSALCLRLADSRPIAGPRCTPPGAMARERWTGTSTARACRFNPVLVTALAGSTGPNRISLRSMALAQRNWAAKECP